MPLVIRGPQGGGIRLGAQHSQSLEAWFTAVPGLRVIAPSTAYEHKGLLTAAIRSNDPVMFLEHKGLYGLTATPVPEGSYEIPIGKNNIIICSTSNANRQRQFGGCRSSSTPNARCVCRSVCCACVRV